MGGNPETLAYYLLKDVAKAQRDYRLFDEGDHIAVALSGGKDSAALLYVLLRWSGIPRFRLTAIHVRAPAGDACAEGQAAVEFLETWCTDLKVPYILAEAESACEQPTRRQQGPCFHCAWRRRKALFQAAARAGCNKIALGHHGDDVAVTMLLNLCYQGRFETMQPRKELFDGTLTLVRPFYLTEERDLVGLVRRGAFPFSPITCSKGKDARRAHMEEVLRQLTRENRYVRRSLAHAMERSLSAGCRAGGESEPT